MRIWFVTLISGVALGQVAGTCTPPAPCAGDPFCKQVVDSDGDGEISDDFRRVRNLLLYGSGAGPTDVVRFEAPPAGTYDWNGEVRLCGDDSFAANPPVDESEPDCDGTSDLPIIHFFGAWGQVTFAADCGEGDTTPDTITPCLHVGDRMSGDGGSAEPRPRVIADGTLHFRHVQTISNISQISTYVPAVWLDGIQNSSVGVDVRGDVNGAGSGWGSGLYVSATNSVIIFSSEPGTGGNLYAGLVVDGKMDGSTVGATLDYGGNNAGLPSYLKLGSGGCLASCMTSPISGSGPPDSCDYGPDIDGCEDFTVDATITTPSNEFGGNAIYLQGGDAVTLDLDIEFLGNDPSHTVMSLADIFGTADIGDITITGTVVNATPAEPFQVGGNAALHLDASIQNTVPVADCFRVSSGSVTFGANYQCTVP